MTHVVKNWKEFLIVFNKTKIDILAHLEVFDEDEILLKLVEKNEDGDFKANKKIMRFLCEMMLDDHPELKGATFKVVEETFEVNIEE